MEIKQVESFVAVARQKSFSKAAQELYLSQPAVTSNVQKLEQELGLILINRKGKTLSLTSAGELFFRYGVELINLCAKAQDALGHYKEATEGVLELCVSTIPGQYLLPQLIQAFRQTYPRVQYVIRYRDSREVAQAIMEGHHNVGFIGAKYPSAALNYLEVFKDHMVLIASPEKHFPEGPLQIEALTGENLVIREQGSGTRRLVERALKERKLDINFFGTTTLCDSLEGLKNMVSMGLGISLVSQVAIRKEVELGLLKTWPVADLELTRSFSLVSTSQRCLSPIEEKFLAFAADWTWPEQN